MVGRVLVQVMAVPVTMGRVAMVSVAGAVPGRGELRERDHVKFSAAAGVSRCLGVRGQGKC